MLLSRNEREHLFTQEDLLGEYEWYCNKVEEFERTSFEEWYEDVIEYGFDWEG